MQSWYDELCIIAAAPAVDEVTKEVNEKKVEETAEILVDEVTNEDGGGPIGEGQALLIDDGSGEGEKVRCHAR